MSLPVLARRRLYARLLVVGSGSTASSLGAYVSTYLVRRYRAKRTQLSFRHLGILGYTSLQASNQFILVRQTLALFTLGRLYMSVWLFSLGAATRFVFSSLMWVVPVHGVLRIRFFLFFLWTLS